MQNAVISNWAFFVLQGISRVIFYFPQNVLCLFTYILVSGYFMMTLHKFIFASFVLLLLTQCNTKHDNNSRTQLPIQTSQIENYKVLIGKWKYNFPWYISELTLKANGTFKFHDQGCFGQKFSEGHWTNENGIILLTSFDTFKPREQIETKVSNEDIGELNTARKPKKIPPPFMPGLKDTVRVYFDKIPLELRNDTLYCVGIDKLPEDSKFWRDKNNR